MSNDQSNTNPSPHFAELLASAVMEPGTVSSCYRAFWNYSLMNQPGRTEPMAVLLRTPI
jgi:hypothetical protein